jgi:ElaB/YqjD/DUF883 family membrane-anchored ribosome-binding protein
MATILLLGLVRPMIGRAARRAGEFLMSPSPEGYPTRLDEIRAKAGSTADEARASAERAAERAADRAKETADRAKETVDRARGDAARTAAEPPTGV